MLVFQLKKPFSQFFSSIFVSGFAYFLVTFNCNNVNIFIRVYNNAKKCEYEREYGMVEQCASDKASQLELS